MSNRVVVLSNRPAVIKNIYEIKFSNRDTPINNRKSSEFNMYYDLIWKDLDHYV